MSNPLDFERLSYSFTTKPSISDFNSHDIVCQTKNKVATSLLKGFYVFLFQQSPSAAFSLIRVVNDPTVNVNIENMICMACCIVLGQR